MARSVSERVRCALCIVEGPLPWCYGGHLGALWRFSEIMKGNTSSLLQIYIIFTRRILYTHIFSVQFTQLNGKRLGMISSQKKNKKTFVFVFVFVRSRRCGPTRLNFTAHRHLRCGLVFRTSSILYIQIMRLASDFILGECASKPKQVFCARSW